MYSCKYHGLFELLCRVFTYMLMIFGLLLSAGYPVIHVLLRREFKPLPDDLFGKAKKRVSSGAFIL